MTPPFRVSHVVFDIDGTLVDFVAAYHAGMRAAAERASQVLGRPVSSDDLRAAQRGAAAELRDVGLPTGEARALAFRRAVAALGCDEAGVISVATTFERVRDGLLQPYADVEETVAGLHERGLVLVAASNGNADMARLPVFRYFSATWFAEAAGVAKPDPRFFLGALSHAGARAEAALMVGDRLDNDYEPARAAGMHAVLLDREDRVEDASVVRIRVLTELLEMVEREAPRAG
ncbi:MAG: HAD family hydrolase [Dehalococcoidia bacterium]